MTLYLRLMIRSLSYPLSRIDTIIKNISNFKCLSDLTPQHRNFDRLTTRLIFLKNFVKGFLSKQNVAPTVFSRDVWTKINKFSNMDSYCYRRKQTPRDHIRTTLQQAIHLKTWSTNCKIYFLFYRNTSLLCFLLSVNSII